MTSFEFLTDRLAKWADADRRRRLVPRSVDGIRLIDSDGRRLVNFGSNDYLGLAAERETIATATGSAASPLVCGWTPAHHRLAELLAKFESTESALLFPTGFAACSGTVATLAAAEDLILSDQLNHASLIDGCRLSKATRLVFPHRDVDAVEQILRSRRDEFAQAWIVTDAVFSMDGHLAPLRELVEIAARNRANLIVDEAHATGVLGNHGGGLCDALGLTEQVKIRIGTLSKAIGAQGGFVAAPAEVIDFLVNRCRSLIYSTAPAPACVAAATEAIEIFSSQPERRERVHRLARRLREQLGIESGPLESCVPIIPLSVGADKAAMEMSANLADAGFFVPAIRPPTVPEGTARLRISLSAAHQESMIDDLVEALDDSREAMTHVSDRS